MFALRDRCLYIPQIDLWVDSMRRRERSYVSHAHSDHAREHDLVIATPSTAALCTARFSTRRKVAFETHDFNEPWIIGDHRLTLFSAGHVLGSAQLLVEGAAGRHVYTGDFKLARSRTVAEAEIKRCDVLVMECTFGRPQYVFPPREEVEAEMIAFALAAISERELPVFFAYSLGKAQEAMAILGVAEIPLRVHPAVAKICEVYRSCGVRLPEYELYDEREEHAEYALIWPPTAKRLSRKQPGRRVRSAMLTGWALDRSAAYRYGVERSFALSDHADFPALLRTIELAEPAKVLLVHGQREFAERLRRLGIEATYLEENAQLSLF
ncbi:MAG TPA: MBL fold metallo-hydrolase RNA specificity domain-containing protein [Candidatus Dormibacteraeota bacterium]|nr:MBL fold metallo-hydrolase RNA specificity domain-containing protein [Candidatus Dormibacteraeota bacterium]